MPGLAGARAIMTGLLAACVAGCALTGSIGSPLPLVGSSTPGPSGAPPLASAVPGATPVPDARPSPVATSTPDASPRGSGGGGTAGKPLPECRYADKPVAGGDDADPTTLVLDTIYRLPSDYAPDHLVGVGKAGLPGDGQVASRIINDLRDMGDAAREHDAGLAVQSAYRSYSYQAATFASWVAQLGEKAARKTSARPGHSEHQLGTAVDFRSADDSTAPWDLDDWATTPAGAWLGDNAWRYGFVLSYPKGMTDETCYAYEPWHFRWVGREVAAAVHASGETLRRYLWQTYGPGTGS